MSFDARDHQFMARALRLAERGACTTRPNPMVGCVIVRDGEVLGEGWHLRAGGPHAEVHALQAAGHAVRGATAYVSLEPCAHHGRTPPCTDALIAAGIGRVVIATGDPFVQVDGAGIAALRAAGIRVDSGLMDTEARALNRGFFSRVGRGRPWLRVKLAMSLDGRTALADGRSQWITSEAARRDVARFRARAGALLTGIETVLADDPRLTVRLDPAAPAGGRERSATDLFLPPLRVVLDSAARLPPFCELLGDRSAPVLWLTRADASAPASLPAHVEHATVPASGERGVDLPAVLHLLAARGINEVQVEAGATLSGRLLREGLVDELLVYMAPLLLGAGARPLFDGLDIASMAQRIGLTLLDTRRVGDDLRLRFTPRD